MLILKHIHSIAHTIDEAITEQASIMVNGLLKDYQIQVIFKILVDFLSSFGLNQQIKTEFSRGSSGWFHSITII